MCFFSQFSKFLEFERNFIEISVAISFIDLTELKNLEIFLGKYCAICFCKISH